jgi:hypothetical protein
MKEQDGRREGRVRESTDEYGRVRSTRDGEGAEREREREERREVVRS